MSLLSLQHQGTANELDWRHCIALNLTALVDSTYQAIEAIGRNGIWPCFIDILSFVYSRLLHEQSRTNLAKEELLSTSRQWPGFSRKQQAQCTARASMAWLASAAPSRVWPAMASESMRFARHIPTRRFW